MYAVIETGNKQYKVNKGDVIEIELLDKKPEESVTFDHVLLVSDNDKIEVGMPYVSGAKVTGKIIGDFKAKKVITFKYKHKTNYHRTKGHRQPMTKVKIEEVSL
ncbi:MAG: 50S ribosomal protein L21 [Candidatus Margulisiibacteriota bacterium]